MDGLSFFNTKDFCYLYVCSFSVCERKTYFCTRLIFRELCGFLFMFSIGFTLFSALLLFSPSITFCVFMRGSSGTERPCELCFNFCISNDFTQMSNFPTRISDCDSHSPAFRDSFLSSDASISSTMAFPPLGNSYQNVVSAFIYFLLKTKEHAPIVHRNHFFHFYQEYKFSESKIKFRQASNPCKRVLEAVKLAYSNKTKDYITETWLSELLGNCLLCSQQR